MTPKQARFVEEYLVDNNASQAAVRAGYRGDPNTVGPRLLANVGISQAVAEGRQALAERTKRTVDDVMADIARVRDDAMQRIDGAMLSHKDALKALELEGKHLGAFEKDNHQRAPVTVPVFSIGFDDGAPGDPA